MAIKRKALLSFLCVGRATFRSWESRSQLQMATAALLFFSRTTLWTKTESFHVLYPPILCSSQKKISMQCKYWFCKVCEICVTSGYREGEKTKPNPPHNQTTQKTRQRSPFLSPSFKPNQTKPWKWIVPKKPNSRCVPSNQKSPQKSSCQAVHNTLLKEAHEGPWRKNAFKQKAKD